MVHSSESQYHTHTCERSPRTQWCHQWALGSPPGLSVGRRSWQVNTFASLENGNSYEEILLLTHLISEFESDQSLLVPGLIDALQPTCTCAPHTQKLWKWQVSSRFPRNRICLMGRSSCCDTVVKETGPKPCIHTQILSIFQYPHLWIRVFFRFFGTCTGHTTTHTWKTGGIEGWIES